MSRIEAILTFPHCINSITTLTCISLTFVSTPHARAVHVHTSCLASALQSFMLGSGYPTEVDVWTRSFPLPTRRTSTSVLNSTGRKAGREDGPTGGRDLWEMHGVWGYDMKKKAGVVLRENYFVKDPASGKKVCFPLEGRDTV